MSYLPVKKAIERTQLASVGRLEAIVNGQSDTKSIDDSIVSHPNRKRKNRGTNDEKSAKRSTSTTEMKTGLNIQSEGPLGREKIVVKMATRADDDSFFDREKNQFTMNNEGSDSLTPMRLDSREKKDIIPVISRLRRSSRLLKVV